MALFVFKKISIQLKFCKFILAQSREESIKKSTYVTNLYSPYAISVTRLDYLKHTIKSFKKEAF